MAPKSILIVDDDAVLYRSLREQLELNGEYACQGRHDTASALSELRQTPYDLLILDAGLPDAEGGVFCTRLRDEGFKLPIIMLADAMSDEDAISGLEAGASDYVVKPFRFGVLLGRIRTQLRAHEQSEETAFTIGPYVFRPAAKTLVDQDERKVRLTEKESNILKYLLRAGETVVGREELLAEVWGYNSGVTTHTLETHIYRLRQKIEADPSKATILVTDAGGYKLVP
ncbi:MAG: response regulator transcription factor [Parvibaculum sp.]|nr:response regulator transcription factor [Parvibaculum sp.]